MRTTTTTWALLALLTAVPAAHAGDTECGAEAAACARMMKEELESRGWVGIELEVGEPGVSPRIRHVLEGSPAEAAGLRRGDALVALDGVAYAEENAAALKRAKRAMVPGKRVVFTVERDGGRREIAVMLGSLPRHILAQWVGQHILEAHLAEAKAGDEGAEEPSPRP